MSTGAIVGIVIAGLVTGLFVPLRVAVAKQRRAVEAARARLAASGVRRRAESVRVEALQQIGVGNSVARASRSATCVLADDGFYCLSDDGRWGARVRVAPGTPEIGDVVLATAPCLVAGGTAVVTAKLADWLVPLLASLPPDGLLLQFEGGLTWFVSVPDPEVWFAALMLAIRPQ